MTRAFYSILGLRLYLVACRWTSLGNSVPSRMPYTYCSENFAAVSSSQYTGCLQAMLTFLVSRSCMLIGTAASHGLLTQTGKAIDQMSIQLHYQSNVAQGASQQFWVQAVNAAVPM